MSASGFALAVSIVFCKPEGSSSRHQYLFSRVVVRGENRKTGHFKISETVGKICVARNVNNILAL